ncbi:MAG: hypothetical protein RDV48_18880 [Candidatus Eremiobacteraeota bacterium]|nr:hypothetical protein [Candidatus Eremiobacteraeota bacterium]
MTGFTLVEVIIALLLFLLIISYFLLLIPLSQVRIKNSTHQDVALTLAEDILEKVRVMKWSDIDKNSTYDGTTFNNHTPDPATQQYAGAAFYPPVPPYRLYTYRMMSSDKPHSVDYQFNVDTRYEPGSTELIKVTVKVFWQESTGNRGSLQIKQCMLSSKICKR